MKYTVVVADDEEEIRRSLVRRVKWEEIGFEVVGEAENGADALELVEKLEPDLLSLPISRCHFYRGLSWHGRSGKFVRWYRSHF